MGDILYIEICFITYNIPSLRSPSDAVVLFKTQSRFARCDQCERTYWPATHRDDMARRIRKLFGSRAEKDGDL